MRNFLVIFTIIVFSFSVGSAENDEAQTEAGAGCMTPECLGVDGALGSRNSDIAELCRATLPAHCQKIKDIKLTTCYDDQVELGSGAGGAGALSCTLGLWEGAVDVASGVWNIGKGAWNFAMDSEYRDEALNVASFFFEQFSDSEKIKALLADPILEDIDEWVECLNYKGRWKYVCEGGIQLIGSIFAWDTFVLLPKWKLQALIGKRGNKERLSVRQKFKARRDLQTQLNTSGSVDISKLSPYQLGRLKSKDMTKMNVSRLTDDIASLLSKRQLAAIPLSKIRQMPIANNGRTLSRLSDDQFRAVAATQDMSKMSFDMIEANIKRIRSADIPKLENLDQVSPTVFGQMSAAQIRGMSHRQVNNVTPEQKDALKDNDRLKEALEETRKTRKREDDKRKREEKKEQEAQEEQRRQEEQSKQEEQRKQEEQQNQADQSNAAESGSTAADEAASGSTGTRSQRQQREQQDQPEEGQSQKKPTEQKGSAVDTEFGG